MSFASPATPARNRRARTACQPHLAWLFALQGADQNLSAFSIARLNVVRISRDSARNRRARTACQPHLAWLFALQGADQNLSAFFIPRLNVVRFSLDSGEKSPRANCVPAASGLAFRPPGCGPKPVRFFSPVSLDLLSVH